MTFTCPQCKRPAHYYDGMLGYEAIRCWDKDCLTEHDLNSDAVDTLTCKDCGTNGGHYCPAEIARD